MHDYTTAADTCRQRVSPGKPLQALTNNGGRPLLASLGATRPGYLNSYDELVDGEVLGKGTMTKGGEVRRGCECYEDDYNGLTAE